MKTKRSWITELEQAITIAITAPLGTVVEIEEASNNTYRTTVESE